MKGPFLAWADSLIEKSTEPDRRRSYDEAEQYHHYIDLDRYGAYPFTELPRNYDDAVRKFGKDFVDTTGTLPWRIATMTGMLAKAMRERDTSGILFAAAYLSHYIADAQVPLHTTLNYDGQQTGQRGVHSRWETGIPERYGETYHFDTEAPVFIGDPLAKAFAMTMSSYQKVDSVLTLDREAVERTPESERYVMRQRYGRERRELSDRYFAEYNALLGGMVERQMEEAIRMVASYWYTAWVQAGKPKL